MDIVSRPALHVSSILVIHVQARLRPHRCGALHLLLIVCHHVVLPE